MANSFYDNLLKQIKEHKIELKSTDQLIPYARNARKHEPWQVAQIAASIKEFGFTNPVLIDDTGEIVAGHGRVMAALKLDLPQIPCIVLGHLTATQRKAYVYADNKIALNSSWDDALLKLDLIDLNAIEDFDFSIIGFNQVEIAALLPGEHNFVSANNEDEWQGMPEFDQKDATSFRHIIVHFDSQEHVDQFADLINQDLTNKTKSIWFPPQERMDTESKRYAEEEL